MQTRRQFLVTSTLSAAALAAAGCGGGDDEGASSGGGGAGGGGEDLKGTIVFTTWGTAGEIASFKESIRAFERENAGAKVELREVPFEEIRQNIDAALEAGEAPDVFRVTYQDIGFYKSANALLDLSEDLPGNFGEAFIPGLWAAVQNDGKARRGPAAHRRQRARLQQAAAREGRHLVRARLRGQRLDVGGVPRRLAQDQARQSRQVRLRLQLAARGLLPLAELAVLRRRLHGRPQPQAVHPGLPGDPAHPGVLPRPGRRRSSTRPSITPRQLPDEMMKTPFNPTGVCVRMPCASSIDGKASKSVKPAPSKICW
jgi:hypothetical protein